MGGGEGVCISRFSSKSIAIRNHSGSAGRSSFGAFQALEALCLNAGKFSAMDSGLILGPF
jgi:hypothetical protein